VAQVFVSYSKHDREHARELLDYLGAVGLNVWWDNNLVGGDKHWEVIDREIDAAKVVVVISSENSAVSLEVEREVRRANQQNKLLPVHLSGFKITHLPDHLKAIHSVPIDDKPKIGQALTAFGLSLESEKSQFEASPGDATTAEGMATDNELYSLLARCSNDDLAPLVGYIQKSWTQKLTKDGLYIRFKDNHREYLHLIEREIRLCGGHAFINAFRREGPSYEAIVRKVCSRLKVPAQSSGKVAEMEQHLLAKLLDDQISSMSTKEKEGLAERINGELARQGVSSRFDTYLAAPATALLAQAGVKFAGFLAYQYAAIVANAVATQVLGQGLTFAANAALMKWIGVFAGPIGWVGSGILTAVSLAGPAYRVTIPCVAHIAYLRLKYDQS
jgi:uncharacterized protein YaaW (UPF0174 family)